MITDDQIKALYYQHFINKGDHFYGVLEMIHGNGRLVIADINGVENAYCYTSVKKAIAAMILWNAEETEEPTGWFRSPTDGRRRENGDPNKETINW